MPDTINSFPNLDVKRITDFTPGIWNGVEYGNVFSSEAPLGSASVAYRCYARPGIGLCPLPSSSTYLNKTAAAGTGYVLLTLCDIQVAPAIQPYPPVYPNLPLDAVVTSWIGLNQSANVYTFSIDVTGPTVYNSSTVTDQILYSHNTVYQNTIAAIWPNLAKGWITTSSNPSATFSSHDPTFPNSTVAFTQQDAGTGTVTRQLVANNVNPVLSTYVGSRWVYIANSVQMPIGTYQLSTGPSNFYTTNFNSTLGLAGGNVFFPEYLATVGSWGSVSVGEFFAVMCGGGAFLIYGDIQAPSQAVNLPGVTSSGGAIGEAMPCAVGLVYCTDYDGVYAWNGGNTSQKISYPLSGKSFLRPPLTLPTVSSNPSINIGPNYRNGVWGSWVLLANGYLFDTITKGWWQIDNPGTNPDVQVWGGPGGMTQYFYSSSGVSYSPSGSFTPVVKILKWDRSKPATSWQWNSNPIPAPGSQVMLGAVEICASNLSTYDCTITVQPVALPAMKAYPNQNATQPVVFTIPASTQSVRQAKALGWNDFNMVVRVTATTTQTPGTPDGTNPAPILHDMALGYAERPVAEMDM